MRRVELGKRRVRFTTIVPSMSLLEALGLRLPRSRSAPPPAGGLQFLPDEGKEVSQRGELKKDLIDSATAKRVTQGDLSAQLGLKADAEAHFAAAANALRATREKDARQAREDARKAIATLEVHAQKQAANTAIADARAKLAAFDAAATKQAWPDAMRRALEARLIATRGVAFADEVGVFKAERASVVAQVFGVDRLLPATQVTALKEGLVKVDKLVIGPPPDLVNAGTALELLRATAVTTYRDMLDYVKNRLAQIDGVGADARAAVGPDLDRARAQVAEADAAFAAGEWAHSLAAAQAARDLLAPGGRVAARRQMFDDQRATALAKVAQVKARPEIQNQTAELEQRIAAADRLAEPATRQYEQATKALQGVAERAGVWLSLGGTLMETRALESQAKQNLDALDAGPAAAATATESLRKSARARLAEVAAAAALLPGGNDPARAVETMNAAARHAFQDAAQAKALAASLGPALAAGEVAAKGGKVATIRKALDALRPDVRKAEAAKPAPPADAMLQRARSAVAACDAALAKNDAAAAADALGKASAALTEARGAAVAAQHSLGPLAAVEKLGQRLHALPTAAHLTKVLDEFDRALEAARKAEGADRIEKVRMAEAAAAVVQHAGADRQDFDDEAQVVDGLVAGVGFFGLRDELAMRVAAVRAKADALELGLARKQLHRLHTEASKARVTALAMAKATDATIAEVTRLAQELAAQGHGDEVDHMIDKLPAGTDPRTAAAIAQGRFGVEFEADAAGPKDKELASLQAICRMLAAVKQDVLGNASLKHLKHTDRLPPTAGGMYTQEQATMSLEGRPKANAQQFGANLVAPAGPPGPPGSPPPPNVKQLPGNIDKRFQPADDTPVDVLDWSSLHEVGHGLDDKHTYMLRHQSRDDHGKWTSYGGNVQPIADVVGAHFKFDSTPEQRRYVLDSLMSMPPVDPPAPDAKTDWAKRKRDFDNWLAIATSKDVFRRQSDCDKICIGTLIYHEAYPRQWVSYLAAARQEGLTGYQFRHPGEWFAELYAGYKSKKLRPDHPARKFLEELSP